MLTFLDGLLLLIQVRIAQGNHPEASRLFADLRARTAQTRHSFLLVRTGAVQLRLALTLKEQQLAIGQLWRDLHHRQIHARYASFSELEEQLAWIQMELAYHLHETAFQDAQMFIQQAEAMGPMRYVVRGHMLLACAAFALERPKLALAAIERSVSLAAIHGFVRLFLDEQLLIPIMGAIYAADPAWFQHPDPAVAALLDRLVRAWHGQFVQTQALNPLLLESLRHTLHLQLIPDRSEAALPEPVSQAPQQELLSGRELEVLHLIALGKSNREIAGALVITEGTVKRHINSIMSKLPARSRTHAVAVARDKGLLQG